MVLHLYLANEHTRIHQKFSELSVLLYALLIFSIHSFRCSHRTNASICKCKQNEKLISQALYCFPFFFGIYGNSAIAEKKMGKSRSRVCQRINRACNNASVQYNAIQYKTAIHLAVIIIVFFCLFLLMKKYGCAFFVRLLRILRQHNGIVVYLFVAHFIIPFS